MSAGGIASYLGRQDIRQRHQARQDAVARAGLQSTRDLNAATVGVGNNMQRQQEIRDAAKARKKEIEARATAALMAAKTDGEERQALERLKHDNQILEIEARKGPGTASTRAASSTRKAAAATTDAPPPFADKSDPVSAAGGSVAMARQIGGEEMAQRRLKQHARRIATIKGIPEEEAYSQIRAASSRSNSALRQDFETQDAATETARRDTVDRAMSEEMADVELDQNTAKLGMSEANLDRTLNRDTVGDLNAVVGQERNDLRAQELELKKQKARRRGGPKQPSLPKVSAPDRRALVDGTAVVRSVGDLRKFIVDEKVNTGFIAGPAQTGFKAMFGGTTKWNLFQSKIIQVTQALGKMAEGGKLTDSDYEKYKSALADTSMDEADLLAVLDDVDKTMRERAALDRASLGITPDDPRFHLDRAAPSSSPSGGMITVRDETGATDQIMAGELDKLRARFPGKTFTEVTP